jgi:hypothetical protein
MTIDVSSLLIGALVAFLSGWLGYYFGGRNRADERRFKDQLDAIEAHIRDFRDAEYTCGLVNMRLQPINGPPDAKYALDACTQLIDTYNRSLALRHRIPIEIFEAMQELHLKMRAIMATVAAEQCQPGGMKSVPDELRKMFYKINEPFLQARHMLEREYQWLLRMRRAPWWASWREHAPIPKTVS